METRFRSTSWCLCLKHTSLIIHKKSKDTRLRGTAKDIGFDPKSLRILRSLAILKHRAELLCSYMVHDICCTSKSNGSSSSHQW